MKKTLSIILAVIFAIIPLSIVHATGETSTDMPDYRQLLSPVKQSVELNPGEVYHGSFELYNTGKKDFSYHVYATPYQVTSESYEPDFNTKNVYTQIADWITFEAPQGNAKADSKTIINFTVNVPYDVPAGGQYAALMSEMGNEEEGTINVVNRVGTLFYAKVNGETHGNGYGKILENNIPSFFLEPPITTSFLVKNNGNIHADAISKLTIYPLFSDEPVYANEEEPASVTVLPETSRFSNLSWENSPALGIFKVRQVIEFMGETSINEKLVIICPLWLIVLIIVLLLLFIFQQIARNRKKRLDI